MKKFAFVIIIIASAISYYKSDELYSFYQKIYFERIKKVSQESILKDLEARITNALEKKQKTIEAETLISDAGRFAGAYPENVKGQKALGFALLLGGRDTEGAHILAALPESERVPDPFFEKMIKTLFEEGSHSDIIAYMKTHGDSSNPNVNYWHGYSLIIAAKRTRTGSLFGEGYESPLDKPLDYEKIKAQLLAKGIERLEAALRAGKSDYRLLAKLGAACCEAKDTARCIYYLELARKQRTRDPEVNSSLADAYRRAGRFTDAENLIKSIR